MPTRSADALKTIARVKPKVLVINGGDGTVQAALTELYHGGHFGDTPPPVAVLPNGKTNLIAHDLGADGDPIAALERVLELARTDMVPHIVSRELIALSDGSAGRAAGARHVPRRRRPRRHDPLLPRQDLSARPAQLGGARAGAFILGLISVIDRAPGAVPAAGHAAPLTVSVTTQRRDAGQLRLPDGDDAAAPAVQRQHARRRPAAGVDAVAGHRAQPAVDPRRLLASPRSAAGSAGSASTASISSAATRSGSRAAARTCCSTASCSKPRRPPDRAEADRAGAVPEAGGLISDQSGTLIRATKSGK